MNDNEDPGSCLSTTGKLTKTTFKTSVFMPLCKMAVSIFP